MITENNIRAALKFSPPAWKWKHLGLASLQCMGWNPLGDLKSERNERESCPYPGKKQHKKIKQPRNITLSASLQWCGSQTLKDTPPVPGYKRTLCGCLAVWKRFSCLREEEEIFLTFLHASIIFLVGKQHESFRGNCSLSSNPRGGISSRLMWLSLK